MSKFQVGDYVCNKWNKHTSGYIVDMSEDRLPLVGVECGGEFIRWLPIQDLKMIDKEDLK